MGKFEARVAADFISAVHTALMAFLLFGWLLPAPYYDVYVAALSLTLLDQFIFRKCTFTVWEFRLRRIADPTINVSTDYLTYYTHKIFPDAVSDEFVDRISLVFLSVSILIAALNIAGNLK